MPTKLIEVCESVYFPLRLNLGEKTRRQYRIALADWRKLLGRDPVLEDLDDDALTIWMRNMMDRRPPLSPFTINERSGRIRTLWSWLFHKGRVKTHPTVQRINCPDPQPRAWSEIELDRLFLAASTEGGMIAGVPARLWWQARLSWHWFTGARKGETDVLRWDWLDLDKRVAIVPALARKGRRKIGSYHMPAELVGALRAIALPARDLVFPWDRSEGCYYYAWDRILKRAGLPRGRKSKTQALRVSHATWVCAAGGDATASLTHSDPSTTRRHYLDQRFLPRAEVSLFSPLANEPVKHADKGRMNLPPADQHDLPGTIVDGLAHDPRASLFEHFDLSVLPECGPDFDGVKTL
jgi:integrase